MEATMSHYSLGFEVVVKLGQWKNGNCYIVLYFVYTLGLRV